MTTPSLTPRRPLTRAARRLSAVAASLAIAATLVVTGCSVLPSGTSSPEKLAAGSHDAAAPTAGPTVTAKGGQPASDAAALAEGVKASLTALGATTKLPNRGQMMAAMVDAGASRGKVEVSIDRTPTGLAVDAMEAAAPVAKECVIGQVRDGRASVTILPILASGRCFIGDQR
ncbi:DUF6993 domain-containing protein [Arthrobacter wenxiniae]|uniref:DUF6993 domain-containing protein n=1 Tax=Arthrobacter wenxiniae TaxID=2713570 RepID=UPI001FE2D11D|nr:hypothetical protein [Arthrobacter wenxiniae]